MTGPSPAAAPTHFSAFARALHWVTAVLVLVAFIYGPGGPEDRVYLPSRDFERQLHETLGASVFILALVRVAWRIGARRPEPVPASRWMGLAAKVVQAALYALLFVVPLTAVASAWLEGHPLAFLGNVTLAAPVSPSHDLGVTMAEIHGWLGDVFLWVAGLHALAAIYHHVVLKDGVLKSMLPSR